MNLRDYVSFSISCPPLYVDFERMYNCLEYINNLRLPYKLHSIVRDFFTYERSLPEDTNNLFLLIREQLQIKSLLVAYSNEVKGKQIELSHEYRISEYEWPQREYSDIHLNLPFAKDVDNAILFNLVKAMAEIFHAFKVTVRHPLTTFSPMQQRKYCVDCKFQPPYGLPELPHLYKLKIDEYNYPSEINWMQFLHKDIIKFIGITEASLDRLFYKAVHSPDFGWTYQLTSSPLDNQDTSHMTKVRNIFDLYPKFGGLYLFKDQRYANT